MRTFLSLTLVLLIGCATPAAYVPTVAVSPTKRVEMQPLPPDPSTEALPAGTPAGEWLEPLEKGQPASKSGLLTSEARATRDGLFRIRYPELRRNYEADRMVWQAHRELYEERLKAADEALKKAEPGWFQQHAFQLGVVGGFLIGAATTVALTFALHSATTTPSP